MINLVGGLNVINASLKAKVKKLVFISSGGTVYGTPQYIPITENHPLNPICSYGINKLGVEKYCYLYKEIYDLNVVILRLANPYGDRQRLVSSQGVVPAFLDRAISGKPLEIWGDGSTIRDFLYISDVINAILQACFYNGSEYIFNIGSGSGVSLNDLVRAIETEFHQSLDVIYKPSRGFDVPINVLCIKRAQSLLNWSPKISIAEGLSRFRSYLGSLH